MYYVSILNIKMFKVQLTFRADNLLGVLLQLEGHVADPDLSHGEVRPVDLALLAQLRQQLHGLHGVPPLIVAASEKKIGHGDLVELFLFESCSIVCLWREKLPSNIPTLLRYQDQNTIGSSLGTAHFDECRDLS